HLRERDVVTPREEALLRSLVRSDRHTVRREDLTHRRSLKARQPRAAFAATQRVGPPDHLDLEMRDERAVRTARMLHVPARTEQAALLARRRHEDDRPLRARTG